MPKVIFLPFGDMYRNKNTLKGTCLNMQNVKELSTKEIKQTSGGGGAGIGGAIFCGET